MNWMYLLIAGFFEIFWAIGMKLSNGFSILWISILTIIGMIASFYFLSLALKTIPLGTAYAIWTGIGSIGTAVLGCIIFKEPATTLRILCIVMILSGVIGLKIFTNN
jgi:quaternary ammonium compound-resistance protein SugE